MSNKIFVGQSSLRIRLTTGVDITGATCKIKYKKPDNSTGEFSPCPIESNSQGIFYYDVQDTTELDQAGRWKFWAHVTFSDGRVAPGETVEVRVYRPGSK